MDKTMHETKDEITLGDGCCGAGQIEAFSNV
jgi:hypothetical protein